MNYPWYIQLALTLVPSLVVAVITALLTITLSLRKFYTERWWERKADAYSRIVEALLRYKDYVEQKLEIEMSYPRNDTDDDNVLEKQWMDANAELERAVDLGAFLICEKTEEIIRKFLNRHAGDLNHDTRFDLIESDLRRVKECLSQVKASAKRDLKF